MTTSTKTDDKATLAFAGLCNFVAWWESFKALHCEGIYATWSCDADLVVRFVFRKGCSGFNYKLDLRDRYIPKAVLEMQVGLLKLQAIPIIAKPNDSDSQPCP
jgi:hypothetical protein